MPNPRYINVAADAYSRYNTWITDQLIPILPFPRVMSLIVVSYAALTEKTHFEAVVNIRPQILDWVWQFNEVLNAGDTYTGWHGAWSYSVVIHEELLWYFNDQIRIMNDTSRKCTEFSDYRRYREVSIADQYIKNALVITSDAWPIGESNLRIYRGKPKMIPIDYIF